MNEAVTIPFGFATKPWRAWSSDQEMVDLLCWFTGAKMPTKPFDLVPHGSHPVCCIRVLDPAAYYAALQANITAGPLAPTALGLKANLRQLQNLFGQQ